ncbi:tetratricopeptide repeat protein [Candidatus Fermentibacteria bacterium]|nr:tetratricopeptide repeat protein [Candidatus Fermentibacteria bacterium]
MRPVYVVMLLAASLLVACGGGKQLKPVSVLDTPEGAYRQGMDYLNTGKPDLAGDMFVRSRDLAKTAKRPYAPAHEGLGLVHLERGELEKAEKEMDESLDQDGRYAMARVGLGRVKAAQGKLDDAVKQFDKALDTTSRDGKPQPEAYKFAWFYKAAVQEKQNLTDAAEASYAKALEIDPKFLKASEAWERLQEIRRATAGQSEVMRKVAVSPAITKAELSGVLVELLPLDRIYRHRMSDVATPPDLVGSWARGFAEKVLSCGILDVAPDGSFIPDETLPRAELAMVMQRILVEAFRDPSLETKYVGETKADFSDLSPQSPYYNPVRLMTARGIMKGKMDGAFGVMDNVPGSEALEILRRFKAELE